MLLTFPLGALHCAARQLLQQREMTQIGSPERTGLCGWPPPVLRMVILLLLLRLLLLLTHARMHEIRKPAVAVLHMRLLLLRLVLALLTRLLLLLLQMLLLPLRLLLRLLWLGVCLSYKSPWHG